MLRSSKSKLWSMFGGGLLAGWLVSCLLPPSPTSAEHTADGVPFAEINARISALEAKSSLLSVDDGKLVVKGPVEFATADNTVTASINGVDPTRGIIAILSCPSEPDRQSLTVNGPALFRGENGSSVQMNDCQDDEAPAVVISIPTLPMIRPIGLQVNSRDEQASFSADGLEFENRQLATHSCLNSIELLVRCGGGNASPAGIRTNLVTGETSVYAEEINGVNAGFNSLFSFDITTFNLTEITGTDNPY
jgi:hypothetical protein